MDFDFDNTTVEDMKDEIYKCVNEECITFVQTHGGFHCLIEVEKIHKQFKDSYYNSITNISKCDKKSLNKSGLLPCPGCCHGDKIPKFVK
jgi:hypothetical protein